MNASDADLAAELLKRVRWPARRLAAYRERALRSMVHQARLRSSWHRERLRAVDVDALTIDGLGALPPMSKEDLMAHFDAIVAAPELRRARLEAWLDGTDDRPLPEGAHAVASSGSDGQRGVFVYGAEAWRTSFLCFLRGLAWDLLRARAITGRPLDVAVVAAGKPSHMSCALFRSFDGPGTRFHLLPATLSHDAIRGGLAALRPEVLLGYPSVLRRLAEDTRRGALDIAPRHVVATAEPLSPETRDLLSAAWPATAWNVWATSESGPNASSCGRGEALHVNEDLVVLEPVDEEGRPVPPGARSAAVLVTNLYNPLLPLVRYRLEDQVTPLAGSCACGAPFARVDGIVGRANDSFAYGRLTVDSFVFESALEREGGVLEYQVHQTPDGAEVTVRAAPGLDLDRVQRHVVEGLEGAGLRGARVSVRAVARPAQGATGKVRRFLPLPA